MPNKIKLTRLDEGGEGQVVIIDSVTHLGRTQKLKDYEVRKTPKDFCDAKVAVFIGEKTVSRNQVLIYPPTDTSLAIIEDLNSKNGTWLNGEEIPLGEKTPITGEQAIIKIGNVRFRYEAIPGEQSLNYGLMVGHYGGNLRGISNDVIKLKREFKRRGFGIEELINEEATKENILTKLGDFKGRISEDSIFLFYFSGHGDEEGNIEIQRKWLNNTLAPEELFEALEDYRGQKLLILDGCYTDAMAKHELPPRSVLIGTKGKAYESRRESMVIGNTDGPVAGEPPVMGDLTRAIYNILKNHKGSFSVDYLVNEARKDKQIICKQQKIGYHPMTQIMLATRI